MIPLLILLLVASLAAMAITGHHAFQLHIKAARLETTLESQQARYSQEQKKFNDYVTAVKAKYRALSDQFTNLQAENRRLLKWKDMADAELKAEEMRRNASSLLEQAKSRADQLTSDAEQRAAKMLADAEEKASTEVADANEAAKNAASEAKAKAKALKEEARAILDSASREGARIVDNANRKAEEAAGGALDALKNASLYERTAKAMKNTIRGYGNEYIVPGQSLLDELAEGFGYTDAGRELKRARELTKTMMRNGTAAACDYAESSRRETAVNFVVDAFCGKVDSILSRVKHDNAGKLEQQIRDAMALVNFNGKAFRNARIRDEFLAARLDELKWAAIAQQLALREREEQRQTREEAREEARAERERDRALREAAKEEQMLQKAIEQARQQFEQASDDQKAMYEVRLREMTEKLNEAEERKARATSMAQQTTKGHVYIISNIGSFGEEMYKIGLTRRWDPYDRVRELGDASVPFEFDVHAMILAEDAPALEEKLHKCFVLSQVNKVNHRKEFFRVALREIREQVEHLEQADELGLTGVKWTMTAEAKEYYESQAIDKAIENDPAMREAWLNRQLTMDLATAGQGQLVPGDDEEEME